MKYNMLIALAFLFVSITGFSQTSGDSVNGEIVSVYTDDRDTLYFPNDSMGEIFKEAWEMEKERSANLIRKEPEIMLVPYSKLKHIMNERDDVIANITYNNHKKFNGTQ